MDRIRTLIVEDEPLARLRLSRILDRRSDFQVIGECGNGLDALKSIREQRPDLVLLDVQIPELDGFEIIKTLKPEEVPDIIFVTAHDRYALKAFEVHALDYLLKPFDDERLEQALQRATLRIRDGELNAIKDRLTELLRNGQPEPPGIFGSEDVEKAHPSPLDRLVIRQAGKVLLVKTETIDWIEAAGVYVQLHVGDRTHLMRETMANLEEQLDPNRFVRIHRSIIINVERVQELRPYFHGEYIVTLEGGKELKLSRSYREKLGSILGKPS